ncbi:hypothetical protein C8R44DRAFT_728329 [Mycena epipterygia]|nr:hypothetical protein C8R44DRAFT_728329 [Mycena epipterygia]
MSALSCSEAPPFKTYVATGMSALIRIRSAEIRNEIMLKYYVHRAAGGAVLIVSEETLFTRQGEKCYVIGIHGLKSRSKIWQYDRRRIESRLKSPQAGDDWRDHAFKQSGWFEVLSLYWPTVYDEPAT